MFQASPNNESWAMWRDPDGITIEIAYIVTQGDEGPEYMEFRPFWNGTGSSEQEAKVAWERLNDEDLSEETLKELDAFFHGPLRESIGLDMNLEQIYPGQVVSIEPSTSTLHGVAVRRGQKGDTVVIEVALIQDEVRREHSTTPDV